MIYEGIDRWNSPYIEHHGVKGMKWGVRKAYHNFQSRRYRRAAAKVQVDIDSFKGHENGIKTKNGKTVLSKKEISGSIKGLEAVRNKNIAKAKRHEEWKDKGLTKGQKTALKVGVGVAVVAGAAATAYALKKYGAKPAPLTTEQLKSMGVATFEPDRISINKTALNTPVKNIMRGKSTWIKTYGQDASDVKRTRSLAKEGILQVRSMKANSRLRTMKDAGLASKSKINAASKQAMVANANYERMHQLNGMSNDSSFPRLFSTKSGNMPKRLRGSGRSTKRYW